MSNKFLSVEWFKSKIENSVEKVITKRLDSLMQEIELEERTNNINTSYEEVTSLYKSIKLVNNVLTVVLNDGSIITKSDATTEDFVNVKCAGTEKELLSYVQSIEVLKEKEEYQKEVIKAKTIRKGIDLLTSLNDFKEKDGCLYLSGIPRTIPELLVEKFFEVIGTIDDKIGEEDTTSLQQYVNMNEEFQSLKKFWMKCCLNPNAQSAEDLYIFLSNHQFKIDRHGNFYAYRRVVSKGNDNKELVEFISNTYNKVKAIWKKSPKDYTIYSSDDFDGYKFIKSSSVSSKDFQDRNHKVIGNLQELYLDLPNMLENSYTSAHTGKEDYKIGEVQEMPRHYGDDNNSISCSKGFHAASKAYDYTGFGDVPILVIINPMDVLAVPMNEVGKLRTCRWFFAMTLSEDEKYILDDNSFDVSELGDIFEEKCLDGMEQYVQMSFVEEVTRHTFTIPTISNKEIYNIVMSLSDMKKEIENRISVIN